MWIKLKNAVINVCGWIVAIVLIILGSSVTLLVPITIILGCLKLISMIFGV